MRPVFTEETFGGAASHEERGGSLGSYISRTDGPGSALHVGREAVRGWPISIVCMPELGIPNSAAYECTIAAM